MADHRYWFVSWETVSLAGGTNLNSAVLEDTHPFEYLKILQERFASRHQVVLTILSFRPIDATEYALGEEAGLA